MLEVDLELAVVRNLDGGALESFELIVTWHDEGDIVETRKVPIKVGQAETLVQQLQNHLDNS